MDEVLGLALSVNEPDDPRASDAGSSQPGDVGRSRQASAQSSAAALASRAAVVAVLSNSCSTLLLGARLDPAVDRVPGDAEIGNLIHRHPGLLLVH